MVNRGDGRSECLLRACRSNAIPIVYDDTRNKSDTPASGGESMCGVGEARPVVTGQHGVAMIEGGTSRLTRRGSRNGRDWRTRWVLRGRRRVRM